MSYILELLQLSRADLAAARLLHQHSHYPQACFLYQQAAEKGNKALGLLHGSVKVDQLQQQIGHKQFEIYKIISREQTEKLKAHHEQMAPYPDAINHEFYKRIDFANYSNNLSNGKASIDRILSANLVNIPEHELTECINKLQELQQFKFPARTLEMEEEAIRQYFEYCDFLQTLNPVIGQESRKQLTEILNDAALRESFLSAMIDQGGQLICDDMFISQTLAYSAAFTDKHVSRTRYITDSISPLYHYTATYPLVKNLPVLLDLLDDALSRFEKLEQEPSQGSNTRNSTL